MSSEELFNYLNHSGMFQMRLLMRSTCGMHSAFPYPLFLYLR
jgi:hypothetical protein